MVKDGKLQIVSICAADGQTENGGGQFGGQLGKMGGVSTVVSQFTRESKELLTVGH